MNPKLHRRRAVKLIAAAVATAAIGIGAPAYAHDDDHDRDHAGSSLRSAKLFISTNAPTGNEVLIYARSASGPATLLSRVTTQGIGTGSGLGSQGAVTLSRDGRYLFVVNAASNSVSTFALEGGRLVLKSVVDSGGTRPTSVTENDGLVYVLNAGGSVNITGFRNQRGQLASIVGAVGTLSAATGTGPAQVGFSDEGNVLVVTERNTNQLVSFRVKRDGTLQQKTVTPSAGAVPFGFAFTRRDYLIVSEAAGSTVSSYRFDERSAVPQLVTPALSNTQGAACWIAVTPNGRLAFSANAATSSISSFKVARDGQLSLLAAQAGLTGANAGAVDMAVSPGGTQLHVFASRGLQIVSYTISSDGLLTPLGAAGGMPAGSAGLAAN
jgi:6-phosphogluconolactonase (cycloisomerase 2 family)